MKKLILIGLLIILSSCQSTYSNIEPTKNDIWVSIMHAKGSFSGNPNAKVSKNLYNSIVSGKITKGFIELKNVHWESQGQLKPQSIAGKPWGYGDNTIINIENIIRIIPLSDDAISIIEK